jgi:hypothetical protein
VVVDAISDGVGAREVVRKITNDGFQAAYPVPIGPIGGRASEYRGLNKRDVFALAALQGLLAGRTPRWSALTPATDKATVAADAYDWADAMLDARGATRAPASAARKTKRPRGGRSR